MKKQRFKPKAHSRKSRKSRNAARNIRNPTPKVRNIPPDDWVEVTYIIFWEENFPIPSMPSCPLVSELSVDQGARGEPLGRPNGPKVGGVSLVASQRCYPPKAEGQGPLLGLDPLPSGERLPSLFTFQRGVPCNTPLHVYRGNMM